MRRALRPGGNDGLRTVNGYDPTQAWVVKPVRRVVHVVDVPAVHERKNGSAFLSSACDLVSCCNCLVTDDLRLSVWLKHRDAEARCRSVTHARNVQAVQRACRGMPAVTSHQSDRRRQPSYADREYCPSLHHCPANVGDVLPVHLLSKVEKVPLTGSGAPRSLISDAGFSRFITPKYVLYTSPWF